MPLGGPQQHNGPLQHPNPATTPQSPGGTPHPHSPLTDNPPPSAPPGSAAVSGGMLPVSGVSPPPTVPTIASPIDAWNMNSVAAAKAAAAAATNAYMGQYPWYHQPDSSINQSLITQTNFLEKMVFPSKFNFIICIQKVLFQMHFLTRSGWRDLYSWTSCN